MCIPGSGICFGIRRHRATSVAHYIATRLHAYGATRRRPAERRKGRPRAPSGHAPIFERAAVGVSRNPSASAGLFSKSGGAAENPRVEPRGLIHNRADALCNRKKEGHGRPRSRKPVPRLRNREDRVESIKTLFHIPVLALRIWESACLSLYSTTVASVGMAPSTAAYSVG